jgi:hypothetical protein
MEQSPLLIIYQRALWATAFLLLQLQQVAGWLRHKPQAEQKTNMQNRYCSTIDSLSDRPLPLIIQINMHRPNHQPHWHAVDALRYSLPLELEEKPFLYVVRRLSIQIVKG